MPCTSVFWNSKSGRASEIEALRIELTGENYNLVDLASITNLRYCLEVSVGEGCRTIVAAGGDGTINALVNALMVIAPERRPTLGIIPLGTANDFAGTLSIPDDVASAAKLFRTSTAVPVDVVQIRSDGSERYFANIAAGGNCVRVSEAITDEIKSTWGPFAYIRGAIDVLPDMTTHRITAICDGEEFANLGSWAVLVANGKTNAGRIVVAHESITCGRID